jgi:hypothetical protein
LSGSRSAGTDQREFRQRKAATFFAGATFVAVGQRFDIFELDYFPLLLGGFLSRVASESWLSFREIVFFIFGHVKN